jgi:hypothetical protein
MLFSKNSLNPIADIMAKNISFNNPENEKLAYSICKVLVGLDCNQIDKYLGINNGFQYLFMEIEDKVVEMYHVRNEILSGIFEFQRSSIENNTYNFLKDQSIFLAFLLSEKVWKANRKNFDEIESIHYEIFVNRYEEYLSKVYYKAKYEKERNLFYEFLEIARRFDALEYKNNSIELDFLKLEDFFRKKELLDKFLICYENTFDKIKEYFNATCLEVGFKSNIKDFHYPFRNIENWESLDIDNMIMNDIQISDFQYGEVPFHLNYQKSFWKKYRKIELGYIDVDPIQSLVVFTDDVLRAYYVYTHLINVINAILGSTHKKKFDNEIRILGKCLAQNLIDRTAKAFKVKPYLYDLNEIKGFDNLS